MRSPMGSARRRRASRWRTIAVGRRRGAGAPSALPAQQRSARDGVVWGVAANRIDVIEVPEEIDGDTVSLAVQGDERTLLVDERPGWIDATTLESFARERHRDFVLHAERLDGDLWSVKVNPL